MCSSLHSWLAHHTAPSAASFIDMLSPVSGVFAGPNGLPNQTLYRGVGDAAHSLLPSAFRPSAKMLAPPHYLVGPGKTNGDQLRRELGTLGFFINAIDRQGHKVPEDTQAFRSQIGLFEDHLSSTSRKTIDVWPPAPFLSILALAQHYGVATRLLDWSLDPYVAAYFAAKSALKSTLGTQDLAVWVVSKTLFEVNKIMLGDPAKVEALPIQFVSTPWADNGNARAQRAVFLAYRQFQIDLNEPFEPRPYDALLVENLYEGATKIPCLFCLRLPKAEAGQLLRLLSFQGYDGATMFPGIDGAVRSLGERFLWPDKWSGETRTPLNKEIFDGWVQPQEED